MSESPGGPLVEQTGRLRLRSIPFKAAGAIGVVSSLVYLAGVLGQEDTAFLPQALFWFAVMLSAGVVAWLADRSQQHGRRMAMASGVAFFVLALFSNIVFTIIFLVALVLVVVGLSASKPA